MRNYQKLNEHQLITLDGENEFIIVTEIDLSEMKNKLIFMKGKSFNYDDGAVTESGIKEIQYSMQEDGYYEIDNDLEKAGSHK